jgi:hypothetical protein
MTRDYGFPIAPECWDPEYKPWGSMYYNWDGPMVCLMIQRLAGINYSIPENTFTVRDHLPDEWDFIETYTPVVLDGKTNWTRVKVEREKTSDSLFNKCVSVENCVLDKLNIEPWPEDREVVKAEGFNTQITDGGKSAYVFSGKAANKTAEFTLGKRDRQFNTLAYLLPHSCNFADSITVKVDNLIDGTVLRYTVDGSEPTKGSAVCPDQFVFNDTVDLRVRAFGGDGTTYRAMRAEYVKVKLSDAVKVVNAKPGLDYEYYQGSWNRLPDFDSLKPVAKGVAADLKINAYAKRKDNFAMRLKGYVEVPANDVYTIKLRCNDGARVFIDGERVVDLDGQRFEARERTGRKGLKKGRHLIEIEYFQHEKRSLLQLSYSTESGKTKVFGANDFTRSGK